MKLYAALVLACAPTVLAAQTPAPAPAPLDWSSDDSARVAFLTTHGRAYTRPQVIVWAPTDSLDAQWLAAFVDSLAAGLDSMRQLIGSHAWQRIGQGPVTYYLSPGRFISHGSGVGAVFISLSRVRDRKAPFLHEGAHELLATLTPFYPFEYGDSIATERAAARFPYWLSEGLPDYLAQKAAGAAGFREGDVFDIGGLAKVDSTCAARLAASPRREEILERVGRPGLLDALFTTDRPQVAPVFYACSQSFTKYVVDRVGIRIVVAAIPSIPAGTWPADIEAAAGMSLEALRSGWLGTISKTSATRDAPPPSFLLGSFADDYGGTYVITTREWTQLPNARYHIVRWNVPGQYLIAQNDSTNPSDPGRWTRIDWTTFSGMAPFTWGFCYSTYNAPSAAVAETVSVANRATPRSGCNGYPFSRMKRPEREPGP